MLVTPMQSRVIVGGGLVQVIGVVSGQMAVARAAVAAFADKRKARDRLSPQVGSGGEGVGEAGGRLPHDLPTTITNSISMHHLCMHCQRAGLPTNLTVAVWDHTRVLQGVVRLFWQSFGTALEDSCSSSVINLLAGHDAVVWAV